jgi:hypothetical protein
MASKVGIANKALALLGQPGITDFEDGTERAAAVDEVYDNVLDSVLSETMWNFAIKRSTLTQLVTTVPWTDDGLVYAYLYPSDAIRIMNLNDSNLMWRVEVIGDNRVILSDTSSLKIRYVFRNTDPSQYSPKFIEALAVRLASELAAQINRSSKEALELLDAYKLVHLPDAMSTNSQEGSPIQPKQDQFLLAKYGNTPTTTGRYYG